MSNEQWMEEMTKKHFGATQAAACVNGRGAREHVAKLSEAPYIIDYEDCIDICNNRKANIQILNKDKRGKNKYKDFLDKFKKCEDTTYILDLGDQTLSEIISNLIEKNILKKTNGESYGPDHWGRKSNGYSSYMNSYSTKVARYIGNESKININELVPIIYDLMQTEIFINAYGTWVKGDTTRKDGKTTRDAKPNNCPKQILQWLMMIIMVITDNA